MWATTTKSQTTLAAMVNPHHHLILLVTVLGPAHLQGAINNDLQPYLCIRVQRVVFVCQPYHFHVHSSRVSCVGTQVPRMLSMPQQLANRMALLAAMPPPAVLNPPPAVSSPPPPPSSPSPPPPSPPPPGAGSQKTAVLSVVSMSGSSLLPFNSTLGSQFQTAMALVLGATPS